ncbi:MAG TPA: hypothetical protein VE913_13160 [Longimicrobium sp.]|nr:hypothetical protein [Longimicrobium sp.]
MTFRSHVLIAVLALAVCACNGPAVQPAVLVLRSDTAAFTVPQRVTAGEQFTASVTVFAGGCTRGVGRADARVAGNTAEIRLFMDRVEAESCPANLLLLRRDVRLRFDTPGEATVRVIGIREGPPADSSGPSYTRPARLERRVRVLPASR